jgi:hypothetical protein
MFLKITTFELDFKFKYKKPCQRSSLNNYFELEFRN